MLIANLLILGLLLGSLAFALEKQVSIEVDGSVIETKALFSSTVEDVLGQNHIVLAENDTSDPSRETTITEALRITVTRAFTVRVTADGITREIRTTPVTASRAVALAGFDLGEQDILKVSHLENNLEKSLTPSITTLLASNQETRFLGGELREAKPVQVPTLGMVSPDPELLGPGQTVEVIRVTKREFAVDKPLPYTVETNSDATLEKGAIRTVQEGKNGLARYISLITCHNGQEVGREQIRTEILVQPQNQVIAVGNSYTVSRGGERFDFREAKDMEATAYTYTGRRTATGVYPAVGMVAVDPRVISLGTRMYIEGYGFATATDTGGAIKGDRIDVFMETYTQCMNWGRRMVKVYLLP